MKAGFRQVFRVNYQQILLVFVAFFIMVMVSYLYISNIVRDQMQAIGEEVMNTTQTSVTGSLSETELIFANAVQTVQTMIEANCSNEEILAYLRETNDYFGDERSPLPDFLKVYGYIQGEFLDGSDWVPPLDYDPPKRPWHIGASGNGGEMFFSEPYVDADTGGMCISFSQELYDSEDVPHGIIAIDLNLSRITEYVASQHIANEGYGILLSDTLHITTHENQSLIGAKMSDVSAEYERLEKMLLLGEQISATRFRDYDGTDSVAYFRKIFNGWHIGIFTPRQNYYQPVYRMGVVLALLGLVLMTILSSLLVRSRIDKMRADEESRSKSNFLARMSHEMRTPMNAIIGMTEIARSTDDPSKIQYSLAKINDAADHLLGVINDVLDMSKIAAGKLELSPSDFAIRRMVQKAANVMEYKFSEKAQTFTFEIAPDLPDVIAADEQRLVQVLTNLLSNANKFTPEKGHISLRITAQGRVGDLLTIRFAVQDDGIGMTREQVGRLFSPFEQADNSISRQYGGTGLGLAISKRIVEMMGGEIWAESEPNRGSTFAFLIQAGAGKASLEPAESGERKDYRGLFLHKNILLAEDVELNREILITLLEETGATFDCAENGQEALEMFSENPLRYDLIFMDIHMPKMDGYEAAGRIRALEHERARTVPIIAMTADVFKEDIEQANAAGMNGHVGKPIDLDEVIDVMIKNIL